MPLLLPELDVAGADVVGHGVPGDVIVGVRLRYGGSGLPYDHGEFHLVVHLLAFGRQYHVVVGTDHGRGGLGEQQRVFGQRHVLLRRVIEVVEPDADDLGRPGNGRCQPGISQRRPRTGPAFHRAGYRLDGFRFQHAQHGAGQGRVGRLNVDDLAAGDRADPFLSAFSIGHKFHFRLLYPVFPAGFDDRYSHVVVCFTYDIPSIPDSRNSAGPPR